MDDAARMAHGGQVSVTIHDDRIELSSLDGMLYTIPLGPVSLGTTEFGQLDPPPPACLTNALGLIHDHLDDIIAQAPDISVATSISFRGHHARSLAQVEIGNELASDQLVVRRSDIEEVFRTLVVETAPQRRTNPGLDDLHAGTIIATCCVVLAIMRRLALSEAAFGDDAGDSEATDASGHGVN